MDISTYFVGLILLTLLGIYIWFVIVKGGFNIHKIRKDISRDAVPNDLHSRVVGYVTNIKKIYNSIDLLKDQLPGSEEFLALLKKANLLDGPMIEYLIEYQNYEFRYNDFMKKTVEQRKILDEQIAKANWIARERENALKMANNLVGQASILEKYVLSADLMKLQLTEVNSDEYQKEYDTLINKIKELALKAKTLASAKDILSLTDVNIELTNEIKTMKAFRDKVSMLIAKDRERVTTATNGVSIIKNKLTELNRNLSKPGLSEATRKRAFDVINIIQNKIKSFTGDIKTDYKLYEDLTMLINTCESVKTEVSLHAERKLERR